MDGGIQSYSIQILDIDNSIEQTITVIQDLKYVCTMYNWNFRFEICRHAMLHACYEME